jgi:hypothetical protein
MIFSHVLYQLSYLGICRRHGRVARRALYTGWAQVCPAWGPLHELDEKISGAVTSGAIGG